LADNGLMQRNIPGVRRRYCAVPFAASPQTEFNPERTFWVEKGGL
jgi:hypothetical protein